MSSKSRKSTFSHRILRPVYNYLKRNSKDGSGQMALAFFCLILLYKVSLVYSMHAEGVVNPGNLVYKNMYRKSGEKEHHHLRVLGKMGSFSSGVLDPNSVTKLGIHSQERMRSSSAPSPNSPIPRRHHHEHHRDGNSGRVESSHPERYSNKNSMDQISLQHPRRVARNIRPPLSPPHPPPTHKEDPYEYQHIPPNGSVLRGKKRTTTTTRTTTTPTPPPQTPPALPTSPSIILPVTTEFLPTPANKKPVCQDLCRGGMGGLLCDCDILPIG